MFGLVINLNKPILSHLPKVLTLIRLFYYINTYHCINYKHTNINLKFNIDVTQPWPGTAILMPDYDLKTSQDLSDIPNLPE